MQYTEDYGICPLDEEKPQIRIDWFGQPVFIHSFAATTATALAVATTPA